ncbi:MAG: SGNH/GDSL hydrolase family protein [Methylophilaceae bacterium]
MQQILVYADSLSWGIIPNTRQRLPFDQRWPGVMELALSTHENRVRVIEDCLNGRRTVWDDPYKAGRNGLIGLAQRIEINSPLDMVILMLGSNDFQSVHNYNVWHSAQGIASLIQAIRSAPLEPGMPVPPILVIAPPTIGLAKANMTEKFAGAIEKCAGMVAAYQSICANSSCFFFDANSIINTSNIDGVHLDADAHLVLGHALAKLIPELLNR